MEPDRRAGAVLTTIRTVAATGSTNADMLELARAGAAEGAWLRAEEQTGGRGRQGRTWASPRGNLYASTLVRLRPGDPPAPTLALTIAVAVQAAIGPLASIKWPNDLLIGGAKVAGMLLERAGDAVVIGIGVNLLHAPALPDRSTASLAQFGVAADAASFCATLADHFGECLARWRVDFGAIRTAWLAAAHPLGTPLTVRLPDDAVLDGGFAGLADDGALRLRLASGEVRVIHAGDVFQV